MGTARKTKTETETAYARSDVYGLLAEVFRAEPTATLVEEMQAQGFSETLSGLGVSLGSAFHETSSDKLAEDLALEFTKLFIGPGPHISPHESANIDSEIPMEATLWGAQTVRVKKFIEAAGLEYAESFTGMPDHISAELELMQRLTAKEAEAWEKANEKFAAGMVKIEERFLGEHLAQWAPRFCDKVIDRTEHPFYRGFAEVTKDFLEFECQNFTPLAAEARPDMEDINVGDAG